jgi:hypothetical protein
LSGLSSCRNDGVIVVRKAAFFTSALFMIASHAFGQGIAPISSANVTAINASGVSVTDTLANRFNGVTNSAGNWSFKNGITAPGVADVLQSLTISGPTSPSTTAFYGYVGVVNGTLSGAGTYPTFYHMINQFNANTQLGTAENTRIYTNFGGSSQIGGFINFDTTLFINNAITNDSGNEFYQAGNTAAIAQVNVGGTSTAYLGHLFADGHYSVLRSGATYWWSVSGDEYDISINSGANANLADGVSVVLLSTNAVAPTFGDFPAFLVSAQAGATATITCGLCFTGYEGNNALAATASIISLQPKGAVGSYPQATIAYGIDLDLFAITSYAWRGPNATSLIDGAGNGTFSSINTAAILNGGGSINVGSDASHNGFLFNVSTGININTIQANSSVNANWPLSLQGQGTSGVEIVNGAKGLSLEVSQDGSASVSTDYLSIHALASGLNAAYIASAGADTVISMRYFTKGSGSVQQFSAGGDNTNSGNVDFEIDGGNTPTSWLTVIGSATALPTLSVHGTNAGIALSPNGTGLVNITNSASFVSASNCGSLSSSTGCLAIKDNNGNTIYAPVYGAL